MTKIRAFVHKLWRKVTRSKRIFTFQEFLRDLDSLVTAFEKEKTAVGQRQVLAKIQLGLIAAQDIGDDKLATVQVFKIQCNLQLNLITLGFT